MGILNASRKGSTQIGLVQEYCSLSAGFAELYVIWKGYPVTIAAVALSGTEASSESETEIEMVFV